MSNRQLWAIVVASSALVVLTALEAPRSSGSAISRAGDAALGHAVTRLVPRVEASSRVADGGRGGPDAVQDQYDAARDLEEALASASPISEGCLHLYRATTRYARARVLEAEGIDRLSPSLAMTGAARARVALVELRRLPRQCTSRHLAVQGVTPQLSTPRSYELFFGEIVARAPAGTTAAVVLANGRILRRDAARPGLFASHIEAAPGRYTLELRFLAGRRKLTTAVSRGTWLLPPSAIARASSTRLNRGLASRVAALGRSFDSNSAIWIQNLATGAFAGWNEDARFPAASTVKLGVLVAALNRFGPRPEASRVAHDLETLTGWSSNLAANRLLDEIGGSEATGSQVVQRVLRSLGATSSTYTGDYRAGTSVGGRAKPRSAPDPPPLVSQRVTTARDLGAILSRLHAAAMGDTPARRATRLTKHEAQVGVNLLLASQPTRDNVGLFRPALGSGYPMAQKNGWLRDALHTAAILYANDGPHIAVVLTYRPGIRRRDAERLGRLVAAAALDLR